MELERGKYYYIPFLQAPSKFGTGMIIEYDPGMDDSGRKIVGYTLLDLIPEFYPDHEFNLEKRKRIVYENDVKGSPPVYNLQFAIPIQKAVLDRKMKKPTKIPQSRINLLKGEDPITGILWSNVIPERIRLDKKENRGTLTIEERRQKRLYDQAHDNLLWIVLVERVAELIAISLRKMTILRGESGRFFKRAEESILRTLPTQRVIDTALIRNIYEPDTGRIRKEFSELQSTETPVIRTKKYKGDSVSPRSAPANIRTPRVREKHVDEEEGGDSVTRELAELNAILDDVSSEEDEAEEGESIQSPDIPIAPLSIPVSDSPIPTPNMDSPSVPFASVKEPRTPSIAPPDLKGETAEDVERQFQELNAILDAESPITPAKSDSVERQAEELIKESVELRDTGRDEVLQEDTQERDEVLQEDTQERDEVLQEDAQERDEIPEAVEDEVLFKDDRGRDFEAEPEEADGRILRMDSSAIERSRRIRKQISKLESSSTSELYIKYIDIKEEYEKDILNSRLENALNTVSFFLEQKDEERQQNVVGYPTYHNADFQKEITLRQDFAPYKIQDSELSIVERIEEIENNPVSSRFKLQNHQRYIAQFLSSNTPYNSLLVYHEVGTGKTCMAIQVAEMYLSETGGEKKALVIAPIAVQPGFKREIFDIGKNDTDDPTNQCTGDIYTKTVGEAQGRSIIRKFQDLVKSRYELYGYGHFERMFESEVIEPAQRAYPNDTENASKMMIYKIAEVFGDGMIIVDEVHNIRDPLKQKKIMKFLMLIARFASNTRMLLMSATPMYNRSAEILPIINILRLNEGIAPIPDSMVFDNDMITREGEDILRETTIGFVSYLRGENPVDFPVRLPPPDFVLEGRNSRPVIDMRGERIDNDLPEGRDILPIIRVQLQEGTLIEEMYNDEMTGKSEGGRKLIAPSAATGLKQTAVCVFPSRTSGSEGFNRTFVRSSSKKGYLKLRTRIRKEGGDIDSEGRLFLHPSRIWGYAPKIAEITSLAKSANGIVLIFTENIQGSAIPIGIALEQLGFQRYGGEQLLELPGGAEKPTPIGYNGLTKEEHIANGGSSKEWGQASYTIISADPYVTKRRDKIIRRAGAIDNTRGQVIKVIIATEAISEGVNFKNIREVHITDAHYHISLMDQVVGRAQRFRSHKNLPPEERNVNVYVWSVSWGKDHPKYGTETADEELYRFAEEKSLEVGKISRILKENAFDCHLTEEANNRVSESYDITTRMIDSQGEEREYNFADTPGSRECDYQETCAIQCATNIDDPTQIKNTIMSEGWIQEAEIRREIRLYMLKTVHTNLSNLMYEIRKIIPSVRKRTIEKVVYDMVTDETRILGPKSGTFTIQARVLGSDTFLTLSPTEITDYRSPFIDRIARIQRKPEYTMAPGDIIEDKEEDEKEEESDTIYSEYREKLIIVWQKITIGGPSVGISSVENELIQLFQKARDMIDGIDEETWAIVLAENNDDMRDPVKRRIILRGIALEPETTSDVLNMVREEFVKSGEIILPGKRDSRMRIRAINPSGSVDIVVASTNETVKTIPVNKKVISYGFHTYRAQGTQKKKRGEPEGMLRLYFQNIIHGMSRTARGFYPDTSTGGMQKLQKHLYTPGTGILIGDILITEDTTGRMDSLFKAKNVRLMKILAEVCTRKSNNYRSPIESQYRIET